MSEAEYRRITAPPSLLAREGRERQGEH